VPSDEPSVPAAATLARTVNVAPRHLPPSFALSHQVWVLASGALVARVRAGIAIAELRATIGGAAD